MTIRYSILHNDDDARRVFLEVRPLREFCDPFYGDPEWIITINGEPYLANDDVRNAMLCRDEVEAIDTIESYWDADAWDLRREPDSDG